MQLSLNPQLFNTEIEKLPTRRGFGDGVTLAGEKNPDIIVLSADLAESTNTNFFSQKFPDRFIQVGVAEQNMTGIAAGLALSGKIPFATSFSIFTPGMNWLQLRTSIAYPKANVKIIGTHSGFSDGADGATHQALEDIALTRVLPSMTVLVPCDYEEAKKATLAAAEYMGPVYIRLGREATPVITTPQTPFEIGKAQVWQEGKDLTIIGCGPVIYNALLASKKLETRGVSCEIINCASIKPLDVETILNSAKKTGRVLTIEEHQIAGGLGGAVAETLSENLSIPLIRLGVKDSYGESGTYAELLEKYGLGQNAVELAVLKLLKEKDDAHAIQLKA